MMTGHSAVYPHTIHAKQTYKEACVLYKKAANIIRQQNTIVHIHASTEYDHQMEGVRTLCGDYVERGLYDSSEWTFEKHPTCPECLREMARLNKRIISLYEQKETYGKLQAIDKKLAKRICPMRNHWKEKRCEIEKTLLAMRAEFPPEGAEEYMTP